jgi:simple sugar transport system ATP-binding protein
MVNNYLLEMKNIYKSFGGLHALIDVSLDLRKREILGVVGDNAAGKSTLMKIITGAYQADKGKIFFEGKEVFINDPRVSKRLGIEMIYQDLALCPDLDVPANLFLGREIITTNPFRVLKKKVMENKAIEILHRLKIDIKNPRIRIDMLSGGQQQAVAIGKAISFNPKIVIMDEPTANLAHKEIDKVLELTLMLKQEGISIIIISHRLDDIFTVSDRIYVLKHGYNVVLKEKVNTSKEEILNYMFM